MFSLYFVMVFKNYLNPFIKANINLLNYIVIIDKELLGWTLQRVKVIKWFQPQYEEWISKYYLMHR